ncbi:PQQ-dependent sugar dehydrogenase [Cryomorphaceae bacterium 1068]|nr:PQQ-dependent sugar dehydrogenase [Cryomorphaceae bacterium 1068]
MRNILIGFLLVLGLVSQNAQAQYPDGFVEEIAYNQFNVAAGILFADTNLSVVWELNGTVWLISNDQVGDAPVIDISEEVAFYGDLGMIGATLDPNFMENGYIYLFYCADTHYLRFFGTPDYNPAVSDNKVSMGRITRYTIDVDNLTLVENSRKILLGEEMGTGLPICAPAHGVGQLMFGNDGSLIASTGDGNTWVGSPNGGGFNGEGPLPQYANDDIALDYNILKEEEQLGAFRSQYIDGLNGKVLRINPETGEGLPNNPFYNSADPSAPRSKIWAMGFRNPYRFTIKSNTGGGNLESGNPGTIVLSDVGDWVWEEVNFVSDPGGNYGWPIFQGPMRYGYYANKATKNVNALNPLSSSTCNDYMDYQDVVQQENLQHDYFFPNPCDPSVTIDDTITTFVHQRPMLSFANSANENNQIVPLIAAVSSFDGNGDANYTSVEDAGVIGSSFTGISGSGGVFMEGDGIPEEYQGWYTLADFSGWLRAIKFDETNEPQIIETWNESIGPVIHITQSPFNQCLYVTTIAPSEIKKICFGGNLKPVIEVTPDTVYGIGKLVVELDASESYDPEGDELTYTWTFEDGSEMNGEIITKTFAPVNGNIHTESILLEVEDALGATSEQVIPVSLNNTPPSVNLSSINEGELYSTLSPTLFNLIAEVTDNESSPSEMIYEWTHILHHNTHFHYLDYLSGNGENLTIFPTGCSPFETYWYEIVIEVTDPGGLKASDSRNIYPDCDGTLEEGRDGEELTLSPNPVESEITIISSGSLDQEIEYRIYDPSGNLIRDDKVFVYNNRRYFQIGVDELQSGVYILEIKNLGAKERIRFVKI